VAVTAVAAVLATTATTACATFPHADAPRSAGGGVPAAVGAAPITPRGLGAIANRTPTGLPDAAAPRCGATPRGHDPAAAAALHAAIRLHRGAARWEPRRGPVRLWVQPRAAELGGARRGAAEFDRAIDEARTAWRGLVPGLRLEPATDSVAAAVRVVWRRTLPPDAAPDTPPDARPSEPVAGRTSVWLDARGRPVAALVELAATAGADRPYAPEDVRVVAAHELGHVLGLAHHADMGSLMAPVPLAAAPTRRDRAVLRRLYALPAGHTAAGCVQDGGARSAGLSPCAPPVADRARCSDTRPRTARRAGDRSPRTRA
jgi:hypothetical protein